jgi:hypothetical protein
VSVGDGGNESVWARLDQQDHHCGKGFDERTRWRVGNLTQSLNRMEHDGQGQTLADETEAYLRGLTKRPAPRMRRGEPGE